MDVIGGNRLIASCNQCWSGRRKSATHFCGNACAADEALEREIRSLLAAQQQAAGFLESPAIEAAARALAHQQNRDGGNQKTS